MMYGEELKQKVLKDKERLINSITERRERINAGLVDEDDCFLSSKVEQEGIHECNMKLRILESDGLMDFDAIFDEEGNEVNVRWVSTKYGLRVVGRGIFANSRKALCKKTGWHEETIRVPVWVKFCSYGKGLVGVYCGGYQEVRWHTNMVTGEYVGYPEEGGKNGKEQILVH